MNKLLTVIVPSYNMEKYLPKCLGSVIVDDAELLSRLDVIVVNDGSKDGTSEIAHGFEVTHPGVFRVIDKPNGHYGSCINAALKIAEGKFVKVLDADDYFDGRQFARFVEELSSLSEKSVFDEVDVLIMPYSCVDECGNETSVKRYAYPERNPFGVEVFERSIPFHILHQGVAFRRSLYQGIDYSQTERCAYTDLEWVTYPIHVARKFYYFPLSVYRYFIGREGQSVSEENYSRGVGTIAKLMRRMLGDYQSLIDPTRPAVEAYVQKVILSQLSLVYRAYLLGRTPHLSRQEMLALDDAVRENAPALYARTDAFIADSRRFAFHYIREFRRARSRNTLRFALLHLYSALMSLRRWRSFRGESRQIFRTDLGRNRASGVNRTPGTQTTRYKGGSNISTGPIPRVSQQSDECYV